MNPSSKRVSNSFTEYNVKNYEAEADGRNFDTEAIEKALKDCARTGGGRVIFPSGTYLTGPFDLSSNTTIQLEPGAVIKASPNFSDYVVKEGRRGLISAQREVNIGIIGRGAIDGNGSLFMNTGKPHIARDFERKFTRQKGDYLPPDGEVKDGPVKPLDRPGQLISISECKNVSVRNVTLRESPTWTLHLNGCENASVSNLTINNNLSIPNSDGIHCTNSKNIQITGCNIKAGDDAIALTGIEVPETGTETSSFTSRRKGSENITVANSTLRSRSSGIRVGAGRNDVRNCTLKNLVIYSSNRGLSAFAHEEGSVKNIIFSNIVIETQLHSGHWWGNGEPIHLSSIPSSKETKTGEIRDIKFSNIIAEGENGIIVYGSENSKVKNLTLKDIHLKIGESSLSESYGGNFDLRPSHSMERAIFEHDIPALYCNQVQGLKIRGLEVNWAESLPEYFSHGIQCENFENLEIDRFRGRQALNAKEGSAIALSEGRVVTVRNCRAKSGAKTFLSLSNVENPKLFVNNELSAAEKSMNEKINFKFSGNILPE